MTVGELKEKLKEYPDDAIVVKTTDNFEKGNSIVEASYVSFFENGKAEHKSFRDAFDGDSYTSKVYNLTGGNIPLIKIS